MQMVYLHIRITLSIKREWSRQFEAHVARNDCTAGSAYHAPGYFQVRLNVEVLVVAY